jgi:hypothetical protein
MKRSRFILYTSIILLTIICSTDFVKVFENAHGAQTPIPSQSPTSETYFQSSFSYATTALPLDTPMPQQEPSVYVPEKGTWQWVNVGPSSFVPYGGSQKLVADPTDLSKICMKFTLDANGTRPLPSDQHTKLYNIPENEKANWQGDYIKNKAAYYYLKFMLKSDFIVSKWNLMFQICGDKSSYGAKPLPIVDGLTPNNPQFQLTWTNDSLALILDDFYRSSLTDFSQDLISQSSISKDAWHDLVVYYKMGSAFKAADGTIKVWIDGSKLFGASNMETCSYSGTPYMIWGIGNYGSRYEPYGTTIYFKDVEVTNAAPLIPLVSTEAFFAITVIATSSIIAIKLVALTLKKKWDKPRTSK